MANLAKRYAGQQEVGFLQITNLSGLSQKLDPRNRPKNTFQQLDNFHLDIEGSLTKVAATVLLSGPSPGGVQLVDAVEFSSKPNGSNIKVMAYSITDKKIYDLFSSIPAITLYADTSTLITGPNTAIPFMAQLPGVLVPFNMRSWKATTAYTYRDAVMKYSASDGSLYVFYVTTPTNGGGTANSGATEPIWPATGTVADGSLVWTNGGKPTDQLFRVNYLVIAQQGSQPIKVTDYTYTDGLGTHKPVDISQVGVSAPEVPLDCEVVTTTPNLNGLSLQSGRAFAWTWYNPRTLHESSPSPIVGQTKITELDNAGALVQVPGSFLPPIPSPTLIVKGLSNVSSYQSISLGLPSAALTPTIGTNFTHIRFYATQDGGTTLFLLTSLLDVNGSPISNSDGSILITDLSAGGNTGYVPLPTPQNAQAQVRVYDGGGPVNLAPDPQNLGPESWSPGYGGDILTVVPGDAPDGQAAIEYTGTGAASKIANYNSSKIPQTNGTNYALSCYIDNTSGNNSVSWRVVSPDNAVVFLTLTQAAGVAGTLTGTYTKAGAYKFAKLQTHLPAGVTVALNANILWADPVMEVGTTISAIAPSYPQADSALVIPAPGFGQNDPPPVSAGIGGVFQNSLVLFDDADRTKVVYSSDADFESFPTNSFQYLPSGAVTDPVMAVESTFDRMIIGRQRSIFQMTGTAPQFTINPLDARHGLMAYRGIVSVGSALMGWLIDGLVEIGIGLTVPSPSVIGVGYSSERLVGDPILPLLQTALRGYLGFNNQVPGNPNFTVGDVDNNLFLLFKTAAAAGDDTILMMRLVTGQRLVSPFTRINGLPKNFYSLRQVYNPSSTTQSDSFIMIGLGTDGAAYRLFGGTQDGTVAATAVTQPLPTLEDVPAELWDTQKIFRSLYVEGVDIDNFQVSFSTDGGVTYPGGEQALTQRFNMAVAGKQLTIKFTHSVLSNVVPQLTYIRLDYDIAAGLIQESA